MYSLKTKSLCCISQYFYPDLLFLHNTVNKNEIPVAQKYQVRQTKVNNNYITVHKIFIECTINLCRFYFFLDTLYSYLNDCRLSTFLASESSFNSNYYLFKIFLVPDLANSDRTVNFSYQLNS